MRIKIFYFFIFYTLAAIAVYLFAHFTWSRIFGAFALYAGIVSSVLFGFVLFHAIRHGRIRYRFDSLSSVVGFLATVFLFFCFVECVLIYPTSFLLHLLSAEKQTQNITVVSKQDFKRSTRYFTTYRYLIRLENDDMSIDAYITDKQLSETSYRHIRIGDRWSVTADMSFFGFTDVSYVCDT